MQVETTPPPGPARSAAATRARLLDAADGLFYAHGIRATSAERVIEQVGVTKVTFYRHFPTKSDLVVAYLERQAAAERTWVDGALAVGDPRLALRTLAEGIGAASCRPGFRGCAFINAAAEFADPADPVRVTVAAHRDWLLGRFAGLAGRAGVADVGSAALQLMILRDGAMVNGYLGESASVARSLDAAFASVLASASAGPDRAGS